MENDSTPQTSSKKSKFPSAFSLLSPSIKAVGLNFWTFVGLVIVPFLCFAIARYALHPNTPTYDPYTYSYTNDQNSTGVAIFYILGAITSALTAPAVIKVQLASIAGKKVRLIEAFKDGLPHVWRLLGLNILVGLIYVVSFLLFVIPFFFMMPRYFFASYYLIDKKMGIKEAMDASVADYKKLKTGVWGLVGVQLLFSIVPLVNIVMNVLYYCATPLRYRQFSQAASKASDTAAV